MFLDKYNGHMNIAHLPSPKAMGSVCIGPLNPLCIGKKNAMGFRTPLATYPN